MFGQYVPISATVASADPNITATPTGQVQFYLNGMPISVSAPVGSNGVAEKASLPDVAAGNYTVTATYQSDSGRFLNSTANPVSFTVRDNVATTVTIHPITSPELYGTYTTIAATVASADPSVTTVPTGSVQFYLDGTPISVGAPVESNGVAEKAALPNVSPGSHTVTAVFTSSDPHAGSGDLPWASSTATPVNFDVNAIATTVTIHPITGPELYGTYTPISATVASADPSVTTVPTGSVQFYIDGTPISVGASVEPNGVAEKAALPNVAPGPHEITAVYTPDGPPWASSTATPVDFTVHAIPTTVTIHPITSPELFGTYTTIAATVASADPSVTTVPTGSVQFYIDGTPISVGAPVEPNGVAEKAALPNVAPGPHEITAVYTPDGPPWAGSTAPPVDFTVRDQVPTTLTIQPESSTLVYGQPVPVVATIASADSSVPNVPTGSVQFYLNGQPISVAATVDATGRAEKAALPNLHAGTYTLTAVFNSSTVFGSSDVPWATSSASINFTVHPAPTTLTAAPALKHTGRFTAHLKRTWDGAAIAGAHIVFQVAGVTRPTVVCTAVTDANGNATCTGRLNVYALLVDTSYTATFAATQDYRASSGKARLS